MKKRTDGFLADEYISHDSEPFDYIHELHDYLWEFVRQRIPHAQGNLSYFVDQAVRLPLSLVPKLCELQHEIHQLREDYRDDTSELDARLNALGAMVGTIITEARGEP